MSSFRLRHLASLVSLSLLGVMLLGTGITSASAPPWTQSPIVKLPPTVAPGANAGYGFSMTNLGPSNIAALYLVSTIDDHPVYAVFQVTDGTTPVRDGTCPLDAALKCTVGAVNAGQTVSFVIAYAVGSTSFSVTFQANTTGSLINPNGHNHGDALEWSATTSVSNSQNFNGGFVLGTSTVQDYQTLGNSNIQGTSVNPPTSNIPVTVADGPLVSFSCGGCNASHLFGEWSDVNVNSGAPTSGFKVTILIRGTSVPGGVALSDIYVLHTSGGTTTTIDKDCTFTTGVTKPNNIGPDGCIVVTKVGPNVQIVVWLLSNGGVHGIF